MPAAMNLISPEIEKNVKIYLDYTNYWDCIKWPKWVKDMEYALKYSKPEILDGYLPHKRNVYHLLKSE